MSKVKGQRSNVQSKVAGFTLVELLVYVAIFALVIFGLFQFLISILSNQERSNAREAVIENAQSAMRSIDFEVRHASDIYGATTTSTTSSLEQLSLITTRNDILHEDETETYVDFFTDSEKRLCKKTELEGVECVTTDSVVVTELDFTHIGSGIRTELTVEFDTSKEENKEPISFQSYTRFRNYE